MNWQAVAFDWNHLKAFVATAEAGSLSGAARSLNTTQPTVGRQVMGLEQSLGVTLFERSVRGLTLTSVGRDLLEHAQVIGDAASRISLVASGQAQEVSGRVTVTASDLMCSVFLPKVLLKMREVAPALQIELRAVNAVEDLMRRDADIAIRNVRPEQPDLIARHAGDWDAGLFAASVLLDRTGRTNLTDLPFASSSNITQIVEMIAGFGLQLAPENCALISDNGVVIWEAVRTGLAASLLPVALCEAAPGIEAVLPDRPPISFPVWLVTHRELQTSKRIRVVYDFLAEAMRNPEEIIRSE